MKKLLVLLLCALAPCFMGACQNKPQEEETNPRPEPGSWTQYAIVKDSCSGFKKGFDYFKYENELSIVLPDFAGAGCKCSYSYHCILTAESKAEWNNFKVDYPQFVFEEFEDENIVKIYGESCFIFGTSEYVLENPIFQSREGIEENVKTYDLVCDNIKLMTVNVQLSENANDNFYDVVLQQIKSSLTVL